MFLFGKKKRMLIEFADQRAEELFSTVPPALIKKHLGGKTKKATKQFNAGVEKTLVQFARFKAAEKPGIYGKAKIHQIFAARLKELGYPEEIADEINEYILTKTP